MSPVAIRVFPVSSHPFFLQFGATKPCQDKMVKDVKQKIEGIKNGKNPKEIQQVSGGPKIQRQKNRTAMKCWDSFQKTYTYSEKTSKLCCVCLIFVALFALFGSKFAFL